MIIASKNSTPKEAANTNLLAEVERQQKVDAAAVTNAPPISSEVTTPVERAKPLVETRDPSTVSAQPVDPASRPTAPTRAQNSQPSRKDADEIDAELARLGGRPVVPAADAATTTDASPRKHTKTKHQDPKWLHRSQRLAGTIAATTPSTGRGIPLGAHLKAKLLSNLDSRTIGNAPVEAMLATPYILNGEVLLPARTMLYGRGMPTTDRFVIEFTRIRMPDNTEVPFTGIALDETDQKAGLVAARRIEPSRTTGPGLGSKVARGTANTVLGTVSGGLGKDLVRSAGSEVVNHEDSNDAGAGSNTAILLDAPLVFTIFVSAAF